MRDRFEEMAERVRLDLELYGVRQSIDGRRRVIAEALRAAYERGAGEGRAKGREDVGKYSNAIGLIESAIGYAGARPLRETVAAVQRLVAEREAALREVAVLRDEVERLRDDIEMACENTPRPGCECPGCETARERAHEFAAELLEVMGA